MPAFSLRQRVTVITPNIYGSGQSGTVKIVEAEVIYVQLDNGYDDGLSGFNPSDLAPVEAAPVAEQIVVADILDQLVVAIEVARVKSADNLAAATRSGKLDEIRTARSWNNALENGYDWLIQQETITYDREHAELTIESSSQPGTFWHANGHCGCTAGQLLGICYHRSAARLVRRALEVQARAPKPTFSQVEKARITADVMELFPA